MPPTAPVPNSLAAPIPLFTAPMPSGSSGAPEAYPPPQPLPASSPPGAAPASTPTAQPAQPPAPDQYVPQYPYTSADAPSQVVPLPGVPAHEPFGLGVAPVIRAFPATELYPAELRPMLTRHRLRRRRHRTAASMLTGAALAFGVSALRPWAALIPSPAVARDPAASAALGHAPRMPGSIAVAGIAAGGSVTVTDTHARGSVSATDTHAGGSVTVTDTHAGGSVPVMGADLRSVANSSSPAVGTGARAGPTTPAIRQQAAIAPTDALDA